MKSKYSVINYNFDDVSPEWTYDNLTDARKAYVDRILEFGEAVGIDLSEMTFSRKQLKAVSLSFKDNDDVPNWIVKDHDRRALQGVYTIPEVVEKFTGESPLSTMVLVIEDEDTAEDADQSAYQYDDIDPTSSEIESIIAELEESVK